MNQETTTSAADEDPSIRDVLTIRNKKGLHARASAKFVKCVEQFDCHMTVSREGMTVTGTSIMGLMMLAAHPGTHISVEVRGPERRAALEAIKTLVEAKFDED